MVATPPRFRIGHPTVVPTNLEAGETDDDGDGDVAADAPDDDPGAAEA